MARIIGLGVYSQARSSMVWYTGKSQSLPPRLEDVALMKEIGLRLTVYQFHTSGNSFWEWMSIEGLISTTGLLIPF
jgi:hypothetical protein